MNGNGNGKLAADYLHFHPITGRPFIDVGYFLEQVRIYPTTQGEIEAARHIPPTVRPLQGLRPNQRGNSIVYKKEDFGSIQNIFRVDPKGEDAEDLAVVAGITPVGLASNDDSVTEARFKLLVEWGIGGSNFTAELDLNRGTCFNVTANYLSVATFREPPSSPLVVFGDAAIYAGVGYSGSRHGVDPSTFTDFLGTITTLGGAGSAIPPFAKSFTIVTKPAFGATPNLGVGVSSSSISDNFLYNNITNAANQVEFQFPLFNGARFVNLFNFDAVHAIDNVQVIYSLAL